MKRIFSLILSTCLFLSPLLAADFTFTVAPAVNLQIDEEMPIGFSGFLQADFNLFNFMTLGLEGNYTLVKPDGFIKPIQLYGGGVDLGLYYCFLSRLYAEVGGGIGVNSGYINVRESTGVYNNYNPTGLYYRGFADLGFRFSPDFILTIQGGYLSYLKNDFSNFNNSFFGGIGVKINKSTGNSKNKKAVIVSFEQYDDINPSFSRIYRDNECGILTITNHESAEIRNVHIYFEADKYTNSMVECGVISKLNRYKKTELPLYIDFSDAIMSFSENGLIPGNVTIQYELLGQKRTVQQSVTLKVRNRNAFVWNDQSALSTFVSSETPEIQNFAKEVAGIARNQLATGMNRNIQFAAAMFLALRCAGITYSEDTLTPYVEYHIQEDEEDSILYPLQTMECLSGDYDDFGILLMSCLESQGISCAYMATPDDFIVFVDLGLSASAVGNHFADTSSVLVDEDANTVYMPLAMSVFENGFTPSRQKGSEVLKAVMEDEEGDYEFIILEDAWSVYKPVVFNVSASNLPKPNNNDVIKQLDTAINNYILTDLNPIIEELRKSGNPNKLGVALVRAKRYSEAKKEFLKAGTTAAMNNVANIYVIEQNYTEAMNMYEKVLAQEPVNKTAAAGLESLKNKLGIQ